MGRKITREDIFDMDTIKEMNRFQALLNRNAKRGGNPVQKENPAIEHNKMIGLVIVGCLVIMSLIMIFAERA